MVVEDSELFARYGQAPASSPDAAVGMVSIAAFRSGEDYVVRCGEMAGIVGAGCTPISHGIVYADSGHFTDASAASIMEGVDYVGVYRVALGGNLGSLLFNRIVSDPDKVVYMRAFLDYRDAQGVVHTIYSDEVLSGSYNSLTGN